MAKKVSEKQKCKFCYHFFVDLVGHIQRRHAERIQGEVAGDDNNKSRRPNKQQKQSCPPRKNGNKKGQSHEIGNSQHSSSDALAPVVDHWNVERRSLNLSESSTDSEDFDDQNNVSTDDPVLASRTSDAATSSNVNDSMLEQFNDMKLNQTLDDENESPGNHIFIAPASPFVSETSSSLPVFNNRYNAKNRRDGKNQRKLEILNSTDVASTLNVSAISGSTAFWEEAVIVALNTHQTDKSEAEISTGDRQIAMQNRDRNTKETNQQQRQSKKSSIGLFDALKALDDTSLNEEEGDDKNQTIVVCESSLSAADVNDDSYISTDDPFLASNDIVNDSTSKENYAKEALAQFNSLDISESFIDNSPPPESVSSFIDSKNIIKSKEDCQSLKKPRERKNRANQRHSDVFVLGAEEIQSQTDLHKPASSVPPKQSSAPRTDLTQPLNCMHKRKILLDYGNKFSDNAIPNHTYDHVNQHRNAKKSNMPLPQPSAVTELSISDSHQYSNVTQNRYSKHSVRNIPRSFVPTKPSEPTCHHFSNIVPNPACKYSKQNQNILPPKLQLPLSNSRSFSLHQLPPTKSSSHPPSSFVDDSLRSLLKYVLFFVLLNLLVFLFWQIFLFYKFFTAE